MADDFERLTALIDADDTKLLNAFKRMQAGMDQSNANFRRNAAAMEKRFGELTTRMGEGVKGLAEPLIAVASLEGIKSFVESSTEMAAALKSSSATLKVGTDELQGWAVIASHAHVDQNTLNDSLDKFGKSLGDAAVKGGPLREFFKGLGVDIHGGVTPAFYEFADAVQKTKDPQQQVSLVTTAFGKNAAALTPILSQGSAALRSQVELFKQSGLIIQADGIDKLDELGAKWEDVKRQLTVAGVNVELGFFEQFSTFAGEISSPEFKASMRDFGQTLAVVAGWILKIGPYLPALAGARAGAIAGSVFGPIGTAGGAVLGAATGQMSVRAAQLSTLDGQIDLQQKQVDALQAKMDAPPDALSKILGDNRYTTVLPQLVSAESKLADLQVKRAQQTASGDINNILSPETATTGLPAGTKDRTGLLDDAGRQKVLQQQRYLVDLRYQISEQARQRTLEADQAERQSGEAADSARIDSIKAQDDALLQMAKGTSDYYELQRQVITEVAQLDISEINTRRDADLAALKERSVAELADIDAREKKQKADLKSRGLDAADAQKATTDITAAAEQERTSVTASAEQQRTDIQAAAAARAKGITAKSTADTKQSLEDQYHTQQDLIDVNENIRDGFYSIGAAAEQGFGGVEQATKAALQSLIALTIQMQLLRPLMDWALGPQGTAGGGVVGSFLSGLFGGGSLAANTTAAIAANPLLFAGGGVMTRDGKMPLRRYSKGGVASSPQIAEFGEGSTNEAYIPLPDGRRVPVRGQFNLNVPDMGQVRQAQQNSNTFRISVNLEGANGDSAIAAAAYRAAQAGAQMAISHVSRNFNAIGQEAADRFG